MPVHLMGMVGQDIDGNLRLTLTRWAEGKGVYRRYHSVSSNFATLKPYTEIMQR